MRCDATIYEYYSSGKTLSLLAGFHVMACFSNDLLLSSLIEAYSSVFK